MSDLQPTLAKRELFMSVICGLIIACPIIMVFAGRFIEIIVPITGLMILIYLYIHNQLTMFILLLKRQFLSRSGLLLTLLICVIFLNVFRSRNFSFDFYNATYFLLEIFFCFIVVNFIPRFAPKDFPVFFISTTIIAIYIAILLVWLLPQQPVIHTLFKGVHLFKRFDAGLALWLLPIIYLTPKRYILHSVLLLSTLAVFVYTDGSTALAAALFAIIVYIFASFTPKISVKVMFIVFAASLLFAPWLHYIPKLLFTEAFLTAHAKDSFLHRVEIWQAFSKLSLIKPFTGWGFDFGRYASKMPEIRALFKDPDLSLGFHPHMQQLQLWLELGVGGVVLACFPLYYGYKKVIAMKAEKQKFIIASLSSVFIFVSVNFSYLQSWFIAIVAVQFMLLAMNPHTRSQTSIKS